MLILAIIRACLRAAPRLLQKKIWQSERQAIILLLPSSTYSREDNRIEYIRAFPCCPDRAIPNSHN